MAISPVAIELHFLKNDTKQKTRTTRAFCRKEVYANATYLVWVGDDLLSHGLTPQYPRRSRP